jgi:choline dehydrogenase-like flavoprotein
VSDAFDYVVVGGGPSGCAVAARLAEARPDWTIALIERGPAKSGVLSDVPLGIAATVGRKSTRNYGYQTVPQAGLNGRSGYQPRGRGLGGSSLINGMIYIRGQAEDYESWANESGCHGWAWADVLPCFKAAENNERGADEFHGAGGPLNVADLRSPNPIAAAFVEAAAQSGIARNPDFNGPDQEGAGFYQVSQKGGSRFGAARGYVGTPRPNLHIITDAQAMRVLFEGRRATGVLILEGSQERTITARAEVIISGGTFGSPQLLMCSGIGPAAHLQAHGITVLQNSPDVGGNLQDHVDYTINRRVNDRRLFGGTPAILPQILQGWRTYKHDGTGMLTTNVAESGAFIRTSPEISRPDVQMHFCTAIVDDHGRRSHMFRGLSLHTCVLRPKSRGTVRLANADMRSDPLIDPNFFADPQDMTTLKRGVSAALRILAAPAMQPYAGRPIRPPAETPDDDLEPRIRAEADTIYHPVGTCRMGSDENAVLDPLLRVRGVDALRVVDASVMPTLVSGNTAAPSAMIGERAARLIWQGNA